MQKWDLNTQPLKCCRQFKQKSNCAWKSFGKNPRNLLVKLPSPLVCNKRHGKQWETTRCSSEVAAPASPPWPRCALESLVLVYIYFHLASFVSPLMDNLAGSVLGEHGGTVGNSSAPSCDMRSVISPRRAHSLPRSKALWAFGNNFNWHLPPLRSARNNVAQECPNLIPPALTWTGLSVRWRRAKVPQPAWMLGGSCYTGVFIRSIWLGWLQSELWNVDYYVTDTGVCLI